MFSCLALYTVWFYSWKWICVVRPHGDVVGLSKRFDSRIEVLLAYGIADVVILCIDLIEQILALILALHVFENFLHQNSNSHDCANPER